ncbi:MAG: type I pantothenate kinase [Nitriliruptoraceae bacterium]
MPTHTATTLAGSWSEIIETSVVAQAETASPWLEFAREEWAALRDSTPLPLSEDELAVLQGLNEPVSLNEVAEAYLPLSRLLNLYVGATQQLHRATDTFLGSSTQKVPFIVGVAGSVAVGKSTTSRVLQALLARWPNHPRVALVPTDGFLLPNAELERRGLLDRKGFPESYDTGALVRFVAAVKSGEAEVDAPVYSHLTYDVVAGEVLTVQRPDVLIIEGLNVLQTGTDAAGRAVFVSDFFDFSIYVDAAEHDITRWYVERFRTLRNTAFRDPQSYFHRFAQLSDQEADETALDIWDRINGRNLAENVLPTRSRADLILRKGADHDVERVQLRRL